MGGVEQDDVNVFSENWPWVSHAVARRTWRENLGEWVEDLVYAALFATVIVAILAGVSWLVGWLAG